jgi:putative DNA primase/helicase
MARRQPKTDQLKKNDQGNERITSPAPESIFGTEASRSEVVTLPIEMLFSSVLSEDSVALAFVRRHGVNVRFDHTRKLWFVFDGERWQPDRTGRAFAFARDLSREFAKREDDSIKRAVGKASFCGGVERHARRDQNIAVTSNVWDRDRFLLGVPGGVVDLKNGGSREADRGDYTTKQAAVAPDIKIDCPRWLQFLDETTSGNIELIEFLQRWTGYCLTGETTEEKLVFLYGPGGNGKTIFANAIMGILSEYGTIAAMTTLMASSFDRHSEDIASLAGARLVLASETQAGRRWDEARVKQFTGGNSLRARFMRQNSFVFRPEFKLMVEGNHLPTIGHLNEAIRRRFLVVPFTHQPKSPDLLLEHKLKSEWPGILRWAIEGALAWQKDGLGCPAVIADATSEYLNEQNALSVWLNEQCQIDRGNTLLRQSSQALFDSWSAWAAVKKHNMGNQRQFNQWLRAEGFDGPVQIRFSDKSTKGFRGLALKEVNQENT